METSIKFKRRLNHLPAPYKETHKNLKTKRNKHPSNAISSFQTPGTSNQWNA
jgi:hypothetical protein